jgi:hypothetical protein
MSATGRPLQSPRGIPQWSDDGRYDFRAIEDIRDLPPNHPRRSFMIAYERLRSVQLNGMKFATMAAYGGYAVRLIELTTGVSNALRCRAQQGTRDDQHRNSAPQHGSLCER